MMENKVKHLEMVQNIINRMANSSFLMKGWCITLVSALFVLASKGADTRFIVVAFFPVLMFWILDAYFLRQERLFRKLYDSIRVANEDTIDFSMNTLPFVKETASWSRVAASRTLLLFYGIIIVAILLVVLIVR